MRILLVIAGLYFLGLIVIFILSYLDLLGFLPPSKNDNGDSDP